MIKKLPLSYIPKLTLLINNIIKFSYFPFYRKTALTAPIIKSHKLPDNPTSYRPISLLSSLSKLTKAFTAWQLNDHIHINNIISPVQFGFRVGLSATLQVYRLVEHITTGKIKKKIHCRSLPLYWESVHCKKKIL